MSLYDWITCEGDVINYPQWECLVSLIFVVLCDYENFPATEVSWFTVLRECMLKWVHHTGSSNFSCKMFYSVLAIV